MFFIQTYFFKKWSLNIYLDIQNAYKYSAEQPPVLLLDRDASGNPQTDPNDPASYKTKMIDNSSGTMLQTLGVIIEF
jgi:hypothetical protein